MGLKRKVKVVASPHPIKPVQEDPTLLERQEAEIAKQSQANEGSTSQTEHTPLTPITPRLSLNPKLLTREVLPYPDPQTRPPPRLLDLKENWRTSMDLDTDINTDFEENSPYQEDIISETYKRLDKAYIRGPIKLGKLLDASKLVQKLLPKQTDIEKNFRNHTKKGAERKNFAINDKRNTGRIFDKPIFQRFVFIFGSEYIT